MLGTRAGDVSTMPRQREAPQPHLLVPTRVRDDTRRCVVASELDGKDRGPHLQIRRANTSSIKRW
jgi:hypothetical protein